MSEKHIEDLITSLYDMIQDARAMPLAADKCILERDKALDLLDDVIAQLPAELKQSRTIVESRNDLLGQAHREAEQIVQRAREEAELLVSQQVIYQEAKRQCMEMVEQTKNQLDEMEKASAKQLEELKKVSTQYMDDALRETEQTIAKSLEDVQATRAKFRTMTKIESVEEAPVEA